jgi:hypothetical protein
MQDVGLYGGSRPARVGAIRYQTPLNLLIDRSLFGNYERVTDSEMLR